MLEIKGLVKRYRNVVAVDGVSFEARKGELLGLIGPNGAGKSTTFKAIAGQIHLDEGSIHVGNIDVVKDGFAAKRHIGYVPQQIALYPFLSGMEMLRFVADIKGLTPEQRDREIDELITDLRLKEYAGRLIREYSDGTAKKLAFAAAVLGCPEVLLLDEVFTGLDPHTSHYLRRRLNYYKEVGCAIVFASHILDTVERLCDRIVLLNKGTIIKELTRQEIIDHPGDLESLFIELTS